MRFRPSITLAICAVAALIAVALLARGGDDPAPASPEPSEGDAGLRIDIADFAFSDHGSIASGAVFTVDNADGLGHTLTAVDGAFDSGVIEGGGSQSLVAPTAAGDYAYFCEIHPSMTGTLVVN